MNKWFFLAPLIVLGIIIVIIVHNETLRVNQAVAEYRLTTYCQTDAGPLRCERLAFMDPHISGNIIKQCSEVCNPPKSYIRDYKKENLCYGRLAIDEPCP